MAGEECDSCDVMLAQLQKFMDKGKFKEVVAEKDGLSFKVTLEKDKLFVCQEDECLIVDAKEETFNEVKGLFTSLGFRVN